MILMTEKRYKSIGANLKCSNGMEYMLVRRDDGWNVCQVCSKHTAREIVDELNSLAEENEELKQENRRMTDKLNQLALEFLNYDMVTMGKATEISEMCYSDFLKYRKENGNPMELQL